jgi:hypothetical protein
MVGRSWGDVASPKGNNMFWTCSGGYWCTTVASHSHANVYVTQQCSPVLRIHREPIINSRCLVMGWEFNGNVFLVYIYHPSCAVRRTRCFGRADWLSHFLCPELAMFFQSHHIAHLSQENFVILQLYILVECKDKVLLKISAIWLWE